MDGSARLGWVKLHRKLLDHPRFIDGDWLKVWTACLILATHKPYRAVFGGREITLQPGQFITSQNSLFTLTRVQRSKIERILRVLKTDNQIDNLGSNRNRLISIRNWTQYQGDDKPNEQPLTSHRQTSDNKQELRELRSSLPAGEKGMPEEGGKGTSTPLHGSQGQEKNPLAGAPLPAAAESTAKPRKPRSPDPIWDALCEAFGLKPVTKEEQARIGKVVSTLRQKGATPEQVRHVFSQMEQKGWSPFTPEGLVKWFDQLSKAKPKVQAAAAPVFTPGFR